METIDIFILGMVQGLTEFLPISSSGHLVIFQQILKTESFMKEGPVVEVALHVGTLASILLYYWKDVVRILAFPFTTASHRKEHPETVALVMWILVGTIPTALIALVFKDLFEAGFENPILVGAALCFTGGLCLSTRFTPKGELSVGQLGTYRALCVGMAQGLAILPGISRSGATIVTAMVLGVRPREAGRYSFLLSVPAVAGAALVKIVDLSSETMETLPWLCLGLGIFTSAVVGILCLGMLSRILKAGNFYAFGFYCLPLGVFVLLYFLWR
jgi:undecaprenyl-diphosphatase